MSYSFRSIVEGGADSDLIYYNALLTSTQTSDTNSSHLTNIVKFNETRDAPIVRDASQYLFSIVRFAMNGPGKNLPLFIPLIQTNSLEYPTQTDPNLTIYNLAIAYQRSWNYTDTNGAAQFKIFTVTPISNPIRYISETQNKLVAPVPQTSSVTGIKKQDLSSRYYWVYSYKHFCQLVNNALQSAMYDVWTAFRAQWAATPLMASAFPYPTYNDWILAHDQPFIKYDEDSRLFSIYGDTSAFNVSGQLSPIPNFYGSNPVGTNIPIPAFVPPVDPSPGDPPSPASEAYLRLFFNGNLFGLLNNFNNTYLGATGADKIQWPLTVDPVKIGDVGANLPPYSYTNEILFTNQQYTNILNNNPLLQDLNAAPPPAYNPYFLIPTTSQKLYWIAKQDYPSTGSLWSPVSSIVFTSSMLPLKKEYTAAPIPIGDGNVGGGGTGSPSAFEPIICDFVVDQAIEKAEGWRDFSLYEPSAEYRMVSMNASHEEIRNIDIQVFWKYRLTGELIPLTMFNTSDVSMKMMFRKLDYRS